jgi:hypothetical protein
MLHISFALSLLALAAGMFLLLKVKAENIFGFARWMAYVIILFSAVMLVFDIVHAVTGHHRHGMECCGSGKECGSGEMMCGDGGMEHGHEHGADSGQAH